MFSKKSRKSYVIGQLFALALAGSCSEDTNLNQLFTPDEKTNTIHDYLEEAEAEYDAGNFDAALALAQKAYDKNKNNERSAVLLSYVYLSRGGIDTIQIAESLIDQTSKDNTVPSSCDDSDDDKAVKALCQLKEVMGITDEDIRAMENADGSVKSAPEVREAGNIKVINDINKAIEILCPFTAEKEETDTDTRHECTASPSKNELSAKAHFAWALAHLAEGVAFYAAISDQLSGDIATEITDAGSATSTLKKVNGALDTVLPTNSESSLLNGVITNLEAAAWGLSETGVPDNIKSKIQEASSQISSKATSTSSEAEKLKEQFKNEASEKVQDVLYDESGELSEVGQKIASATTAEKTEVCTQYSKLGGAIADLGDVCKDITITTD